MMVATHYIIDSVSARLAVNSESTASDPGPLVFSCPPVYACGHCSSAAFYLAQNVVPFAF